MSLQTGKSKAISDVKKAFKRAAEMDGRKPDDITDELATDIINAVITLIMSGKIDLSVVTTVAGTLYTGTGSGKVT